MPEELTPFIPAGDRTDSLTRLLQEGYDLVATEVAELVLHGRDDDLKADGKFGAVEVVETDKTKEKEKEKEKETEKDKEKESSEKDKDSSDKTGDDNGGKQAAGGENAEILLQDWEDEYFRYGDPERVPAEVLDRLVETNQTRLTTLLNRPIF